MWRGSGKPLNLSTLSGEQRRQLIDTQQVYEAWRAANAESNHRFAGGMRWGERTGTEYLLRKTGKAETSLGPRNKETEAAYDAFMRGRADNKSRLTGLSAKLDTLAPVNVAMGLARMPHIAARIIRECDERGLLGEQLVVVGTNAIFAYEVVAGVHVDSGLIATGDIDLLYDARRHISLAVSGINTSGLIGLLQKVDESFAPTNPRSFRAVNRNGYLVDLIRPETRDVFRDRLPAGLTDMPDDLEGAAIFGLGWLVNSPKLEAIAIDDKGYPVRLIVIDPRAFALHKAWVSNRQDREPIKAARDLEQAKAAAIIATQYLKKSFDGSDLMALPNALREVAPKLIKDANTSTKLATKPNW
jgi:hypothetical protein